MTCYSCDEKKLESVSLGSKLLAIWGSGVIHNSSSEFDHSTLKEADAECKKGPPHKSAEVLLFHCGNCFFLVFVEGFDIVHYIFLSSFLLYTMFFLREKLEAMVLPLIWPALAVELLDGGRSGFAVGHFMSRAVEV